MLSRVRDAVGAYGKKIKAVVIYGSSVYNPLKSRDIDILVVVDKVEDVKEKQLLELEISKRLRLLYRRKPVDVVVMDIEMFRDNAKAGSLLSGFILGYIALYDEIGIEDAIQKLLEEIAGVDEYIVLKSGRKLNISSIAKAKKISHKH